MSLAGRSHRQRNTPTRTGCAPVPPLRQLSDAEYDQMVDSELEAAHMALHGGHHEDDRGRRCIVCGDPTGIRCCPHGADR